MQSDDVLGGNQKVCGLSLDVAYDLVAAGDAVSGSPETGFIKLGEISGSEVGVWEMRCGTALDIEVEEMFVVLAGEAKIEFLSEAGEAQSEVIVRPGDIMKLDAGASTRWTVPDFIRKMYIS